MCSWALARHQTGSVRGPWSAHHPERNLTSWDFEIALVTSPSDESLVVLMALKHASCSLLTGSSSAVCHPVGNDFNKATGPPLSARSHRAFPLGSRAANRYHIKARREGQSHLSLPFI